MNKNLKTIPVVSLVFFLGFVFFAKAQNVFDIQFPIAELGNCASMQECKLYCDDKNNAQACANWAEAKGFKKPAPPQQPQRPPVREQAVSVLEQIAGPGGCRTGEECNAYCSQTEHAQECFAFAKEHNLISQEEAGRIESAIQPKEGPGGCKSFQECDAFCRNPDNARTCIEFSVKEGKISQSEADFIIQRSKEQRAGVRKGPRPPEIKKPEGPKIDETKARQILEEAGGPGGCNSMEACDQFCSTPGNEETCMNFAVEHGLIPQEEVEKFKKAMSATGPGGCRGRACEQYCENPEHAEECLNFAIENGFIEKEEAEKAKKFIEVAKTGGPGGCRGQRECDAFCSKPENRDECFNFAKNNNLIPPEELEKIEKEREIFTKLESAGGPGGCKGPRECFEYCSNPQHTQECFEFGSKQGLIPQENIQRIEELRKNIPQGQEGFMMMPPPMQGFEGQPGFGMPPQGMPFEGEGEFKHGMMPGGFGGEGGAPSEFQGYPKPPIEQFGAPAGMEEKFRELESVCKDPSRFEECVKLKQSLGAPLQGGEGQFAPPSNMMPPKGKIQPMMPPKEGEYRPDSQQQYPMPTPPEFQKDGFQGVPPEGSGMYPPPKGGYMAPPKGEYMMPYQDRSAMPMTAPEGSFAPMPSPEQYQQPQSRKKSSFLLANPIKILMDLLR